MAEKIFYSLYNNKSSNSVYEIGQFRNGIRKIFVSATSNCNLYLQNSANNNFFILHTIPTTGVIVEIIDPKMGEAPMSLLTRIGSKQRLNIQILEEGTKGVPMCAFMDKYAEYISLEDSLVSDEPTPIPETDSPTTIPESEV